MSQAGSLNQTGFKPVMPPPPGQVSNPENPPSEAYLGHIADGICISLITIAFFTRSYVRIWLKQTWTIEDWLLFVAWVMTIVQCAIIEKYFSEGGGRHLWDVTAAQFAKASYWFYISSITYGIAICFTKIAILVLYLRVFSASRWNFLKIAIVSLIVIFVGLYGSTTLVKIFECTPRAKILNKKIPGHCLDPDVLFDVNGLFNTITDFIIVFLPVKAVWKLKMTLKKKLIIVLAFTFGSSAVSFAVRWRISKNPDTNWTNPQISLWANAELTAGILCACFPEFGVLFNLKKWRQASKPASYNLPRPTHMPSKKKPDYGINSIFDKESDAPGSYIELTETPAVTAHISSESKGAVSSIATDSTNVYVEQVIEVTSYDKHSVKGMV